MRTITDDELIGTLRAVVADFGADYVYTNPYPALSDTCMYVHGDVPGCLIGHVLHRLGVPLAMLRDLENTTANADLAADCDLKVSPSGGLLLWRAQSRQDSGTPWGEALQWAERGAL